jgi:hypothetical protein
MGRDGGSSGMTGRMEYERRRQEVTDKRGDMQGTKNTKRIWAD